MKPEEHPEFFLRPPPEGRSRESSIVLDERGRFFHEGALIENERIRRAFFRWVRLHPVDRRPILSNGYDWTYFEVRGTPLLVERVLPRDDGFVLVLTDESECPFVPEEASLDEAGVVRVFLPEREFFARFLPEAQRDLLPVLAEREGRYGVELRGEFRAFGTIPSET